MTDQERFPSQRLTRLGVLVGAPIAFVLAAKSVAWAVALKSWNSGDTLTAADLNANFEAANAELVRIAPFTAQDTQLGSSQTISATSFVDFNTAYPDWTISVPVDGDYVLWFTGFIYATTNGTVLTTTLKVDGSVPSTMPAHVLPLVSNVHGNLFNVPYKVTLSAGTHTFRVVGKVNASSAQGGGEATRTFTLSR